MPKRHKTGGYRCKRVTKSEIIIIVDDDKTLRSASVLRVREKVPKQLLTKSYDT